MNHGRTIGTPGVLQIAAATTVDDLQAPDAATQVWIASDSTLWSVSIRWQSQLVPVAIALGPGLALPGSGWLPLPADGCSRRLLRIENQGAGPCVVLLIWG